ncbi:MAG: hypothetical protein MR763_00070 [Clostridiales bacterium]|nr:hypothetical protein [Clostridiales bacterium]
MKKDFSNKWHNGKTLFTLFSKSIEKGLFFCTLFSGSPALTGKFMTRRAT